MRSPAFLVTLVVLVLASAGMGAAVRWYHVSIRKLPIYPESTKILTSVRRETEHWICRDPDKQLEEDIEKTLGTKNYITRVYVLKGHENVAVELHAAYYTGMIDTVPHVSDRCFVAAGLALGSLTQDLPIPMDQTLWRLDKDVDAALSGHIYKVRLSDGNYVRLPKDPDKLALHTMNFYNAGSKDLYAGYFFVANGGTVARAEGVRLLAFDLHSTYAYYLKIQFTSASVTSQEELAKYAASLLDDLFGELMRCTPDWVEVEAGRYPAPDNPAPNTEQPSGAVPAGHS
jgi:hypothetical protein